MRTPIALGARVARVPAPVPRRSFATSARRLAAPAPAPANGDGAALNPRWLSELQARIKRCAGLGLQGQQKEELKALQEAVDGRWLELLAGREGFLTGPGWRGLDRHTVTWGDQLTVAGHVNNVVYNKYAESARFNWLRNFATAIDPANKDAWDAFMTPRDPTYESDYILLEALLVSHGHRRPAARCFEDIVVYDYKTAKRAPLKPFMVDRLRETYEAQDRSKAECEKKVQELVEAVERLERAA
ncbi:4-hydroxybenzoyl-thioesterase [Colletotrichum tofieldiae]|nr:4-hydroxybenzoyl-thioesterase [Colletotrichum tofieldiae]